VDIRATEPDAPAPQFPPANDELDEVFDAFFADRNLWVAILTGAGDKAFSAGNDLLWSASGKPMWVPENGFGGLTSRRSLPKPVIAAVNGFAMGGGTEIALTCHLVVADETARFALSEVQVGLIAGAGGLVRLPRAVPPKLANEMLLTGRRLTAEEGLQHGMVNRVVPAPGRRLQDHHARRCQELLDVVADLGAPTLWQLAERLTWSRPWSETGFMVFGAFAETAAHVRYLADLALLDWPGLDKAPYDGELDTTPLIRLRTG
jgi:enoyl-CoA hydratase/carnithine racemase